MEMVAGLILVLSAGVYFIIKHDRDHIRLATSSTNAFNDVAVLLTGTGGR